MNKLNKSQELKLLLGNLLSLSVLKFVSAVVPFIAIPYLIRVLGLSTYGIVVFGLSIISYLISISVYGFRTSGVRDISKNKNNIKYVSLRVSSIVTTQVFLLICCSAFYLLLLCLVPKLRQNILVYVLLLPYMWGESLFPSWYFQAVQKMKYITIVSSIVKIIFTIQVFVFINNENDYWIYPLALSLGSMLALLFAFYFMYNLGVRLVFFMRRISKELKDNFILFLNAITPMLYNNTTTVIMGFILPSASLGVFDAIRKIPTIIAVCFQVISQTVFPLFSRKQDLFYKYSKFILYLYIGVIIFPLIMHPLFLKLFALEQTKLNISLLFILCIGMSGIAFSNIYGQNFLIVRNYEQYVLKATILSSILGFFLSYPLVKSLGVLGGAINIAISQLVLGILVFCFYKKKKWRRKKYLY